MPLQHYATLALFRLTGGLAPRIPPALGYRLADWVGALNYRLAGRTAEAVRDNIRHVLAGQNAKASDEAKVSQTARQIFQSLVKNYYDLFHLAAVETSQVLALLEITGIEHVQQAQALGRGLVAASAHYGNPELMMHAVVAYGVPVLAVAEHIRPEAAYQYLVKLRSRHGLRLIPADGPLLQVYRTLKRGEGVALALDRDTTDSGVTIPFLGAPARLPDGYARLVARTHAPLVIGFARRLPSERLRLEIQAPYVPSLDSSQEEIYAQALNYGVQALARAVTAFPDQWMLTTPIWHPK